MAGINSSTSSVEIDRLIELLNSSSDEVDETGDRFQTVKHKDKHLPREDVTDEKASNLKQRELASILRSTRHRLDAQKRLTEDLKAKVQRLTADLNDRDCLIQALKKKTETGKKERMDTAARTEGPIPVVFNAISAEQAISAGHSRVQQRTSYETLREKDCLINDLRRENAALKELSRKQNKEKEAAEAQIRHNLEMHGLLIQEHAAIKASFHGLDDQLREALTFAAGQGAKVRALKQLCRTLEKEGACLRRDVRILRERVASDDQNHHESAVLDVAEITKHRTKSSRSGLEAMYERVYGERGL